MKKMESLGFESKNPYAMEGLDSSCNKRWKGYSYVEEYMEIILFFVLLKVWIDWWKFGQHIQIGLNFFSIQMEFGLQFGVY